MENNQESKTNKDSSNLPSFGGIAFKDFTELRDFSERIAKSKLTPLKNGDDILAAVLYGKELGLDPMTSVNNIYPINGKATLGVHLINSLLQKAGVVVEIINDYEPCVPFVMKGEDDKPLLKDGKPTVIKTDYISITPRDFEVKSKTIVDYRTTVKLTRQLRQPDGKYREVVILSSFGNSDAIKAGLLGGDKPKDNWTNWTKQMCLNRAVTFGGRLIGADILLGMYETSELADTANIKYTMTEEGTAIIVDVKEEGTSEIKKDAIDEATIVP